MNKQVCNDRCHEGAIVEYTEWKCPVCAMVNQIAELKEQIENFNDKLEKKDEERAELNNTLNEVSISIIKHTLAHPEKVEEPYLGQKDFTSVNPDFVVTQDRGINQLYFKWEEIYSRPII